MKRVLITGGTGSLGHKLTARLLENPNIKEIRVFSRNEKNQFLMGKHFHDERLKFIIGDVRDYDRVFEAMNGVDTVIHAAALKHINLGKMHPEEFIKTNVFGTMNVMKACNFANVESLVFISTDKACLPTNLYGMTKSVCERLICNNQSNTRMVCVRYGNVAASSGSVIPFFRKLIEEKKPLTVTDDKMTRFFITLDNAVDLVLFAYENAKDKEIVIRKAYSFGMLGLAKFMLEKYNAENKEIKFIGFMNYGEKIHESLISKDESARSEEMGNYIVIRNNPVENPVGEEYTSEKITGNEEFNGLFEEIGSYEW